MPETHLPLHATTATERLFPTLTAAQMARISALGRRRPITAGEVLVNVGDKDIPFFVVLSGAIQILQPSGATSTLIVTYRSGEFVGETNMIAGRPAIPRPPKGREAPPVQISRLL